MIVKLLVVQGKPRGKSLLFPLGEFLIGRGVECHLRPNSDWVSRQHCLLRVTPEGVFIRDLGSRNGTLVNGMRVVDERRLDNSDQLQVGPLVLEVEVEVPAEQSPSRPMAPERDETGMLGADTAELQAQEGPDHVLEPDSPAPDTITPPPPTSPP